MEVTPEFVEKQLDCIFNNIYTVAIKIGIVASTDLLEDIIIHFNLTE